MDAPDPCEIELSAETTSQHVVRDLETPLAKANRRRAEMRAAGIAPQRRTPPGSVLMKAIRDNCLQCEGEEDPCVQWRIANCLVPGCTLRPYRPYQNLECTPLPKGLQLGDQST